MEQDPLDNRRRTTDEPAPEPRWYLGKIVGSLLGGRSMGLSIPLKSRKFGSLKDAPDPRDYVATTTPPPGTTISLSAPTERVSLLRYNRGVSDQGETGSCGSHAALNAFEIKRRMIPTRTPEMPTSKLFHYYTSRAYAGRDVRQDTGQSVRESLNAMRRAGVCPLQYWDDGKHTITESPSGGSSSAAKEYLDKSGFPMYARIMPKKAIPAIKSSLLYRRPVIMSMNWYPNYFDARADGIIMKPPAGSASLGGHAVCILGYDDYDKWFVVKNSWGTDFGEGGMFYFPYRLVADNAGLLNSNYVNDLWSFDLIPPK